MKELGILGGTFAPVHLGHIHAANAILAGYPIDTLLLVPTRKPPHKQISESDDPMHRLAMLRLAFPAADQPTSRVQISDYEILSPAPSYTERTLRHFASPDVHLTFFCGTDMFLTMDSWYHPERIFSLATVVHIPRIALSEEERREVERASAYYQAHFSAQIRHLPIDPLPLSSTAVRSAVAKRKSIADMVPEAVAAYIQAKRLYREENA